MNISSVMSARTLRITLLADEWKSSKGGLSTMNRELAIQFAKHPNVAVTLFVPRCTEDDKKTASSHGISIVEAKERPGFESIDWLCFPPSDLIIDIIIGHGVKLGKQAQVIRDSHHCTWVQVVHTAPEELAMFKDYSDAISKGDEKQWIEVNLCKIADFVVAVGPKLHEFYSAYLISCDKNVFNLTPGIFTELSALKLSTKAAKKFRVLVFGRGDSEDFELKGFDIAAKAVAELNDRSYHLISVGAPSGNEKQVADKLLEQGLNRSQLTVKGYLENRDDLALLLSTANLAIIPSRTEGFGLTALEALSAGLPFLVSQNSGFGEALQEIPWGSSWVVDSEDPEQWAEAIKGVREKGRETALKECQELRTRYAEKYSWEKQCNDLVEMMGSLVNYQLEMPQLGSVSEHGGKQVNGKSVGTPRRTSSLQTGQPATEQRRADRSSSYICTVTANTAAAKSNQGARPKEMSLSSPQITKLKELAILGCNVSENSMQAVRKVFQDKIVPKLNLAANPPIENFPPFKVKQYLTENHLKFCVLAVDAETVKDAYGNLTQQKDEYKELLKTATNAVDEKVVIVICDNVSFKSKDDEAFFLQTIERTINEKGKGFVVWLKHGKLSVELDAFVQFLISTSATPQPHPETNRSTAFQEKTCVIPVSAAGYSLSTYSDQTVKQQPTPQAAAPIQQWHPLADNGDTVMLRSLLRFGRISYKLEDLQIWTEGFIVPKEIQQSLLQQCYSTPVTGVRIVKGVDGKLRSSIEPKLVENSRSRNEGIQMGGNETIMLKTRVRYGNISIQDDDVHFMYGNLRIPQHIADTLMEKYRATPCGELYIISDEYWNLRWIVKVGRKVDQWRTSVNKKMESKK